MKIEFHSYLDPKTGEKKLQLLNANLNTMAILGQGDFEEMHRQGKSSSMLKDVVDYCNKYKGTNIGEFEPAVF